MNPAMSSVGFPGNYPYAQSMPLPSAILRPLQQPLYDTENLPATTTPTEIIFFQRQLGQTTASGALVKSAAETNLQQPGQLANPVEFSLFGFYIEVQPDITLADYVNVYKQSVCFFTYTGNRVYLQIPTSRIPQGVAPEGFAATTVAATTLSVVHSGVGHVSNMYKFTIGRSALRIRPTESFQFAMRWPSGAPTIVGTAAVGTTGNVVRIRIILAGLTWTAL
jgi:hypothetical protein